jgi:hypothetical protein
LKHITFVIFLLVNTIVPFHEPWIFHFLLVFKLFPIDTMPTTSLHGESKPLGYGIVVHIYVFANSYAQLKHLFLTNTTLKENWVFATNQSATTCHYLSFATNVGYFCNYFLDLVMFATVFQLTCDWCFLHPFI